MQAVIKLVVTRVHEAGSDFIDRTQLGYQLSTLEVLRSIRVPPTIEVVRASGCDTMNLALGDRLVVAVGDGVDLTVPRGTDPGYGVDNYNSAWYRVLSPDRVRLVHDRPGSLALRGSVSVEDVLRAVDGLPPTDVVPGSDNWLTGVVLIVAEGSSDSGPPHAAKTSTNRTVGHGIARIAARRVEGCPSLCEYSGH